MCSEQSCLGRRGHVGSALETLTHGWWLPVAPWAVVMRPVHDILLVPVRRPLLELGLMVPVPTRCASSRLHLFPCELSPQLLTKEFPKYRAEAPSRTCLGTKTCIELVPARQFSLWKGGIAWSWGLTGKHFWARGDRAGAGVGVVATRPLREKLSCLSASCLLSLLLFSTWLLLQANGTIETWC